MTQHLGSQTGPKPFAIPTTTLPLANFMPSEPSSNQPTGQKPAVNESSGAGGAGVGAWKREGRGLDEGGQALESGLKAQVRKEEEEDDSPKKKEHEQETQPAREEGLAQVHGQLTALTTALDISHHDRILDQHPGVGAQAMSLPHTHTGNSDAQSVHGVLNGGAGPSAVNAAWKDSGAAPRKVTRRLEAVEPDVMSHHDGCGGDARVDPRMQASSRKFVSVDHDHDRRSHPAQARAPIADFEGGERFGLRERDQHAKDSAGWRQAASGAKEPESVTQGGSSLEDHHSHWSQGAPEASLSL
eukprot:1676812-Rhodomonas_salina.1